MNDFSVLIQAIIDQTGLKSEAYKVQKIFDKYRIKLEPEFKKASLSNTFKSMAQGMADELNKTLGTKLTGEDVIRTEEDLYDVVRSARACMYIAIKNYEYCYGVVGDAVTPNMVFDAYLFGCGNVRGSLKKCVVNGEYNGEYDPKNYSVDILYYSKCLDKYYKKVKNGETDGSHDKHWIELHTDGLWKDKEHREFSEAVEMGE